MGWAGSFKKRNRQYHLQFFCHALEAFNNRMLLQGSCQFKMTFLGVDTEIGGFEKLLQQDDLRPFFCRLPDQRFGAVDVAACVPATGHLCCRHGHFHWSVPQA